MKPDGQAPIGRLAGGVSKDFLLGWQERLERFRRGFQQILSSKERAAG